MKKIVLFLVVALIIPVVSSAQSVVAIGDVQIGRTSGGQKGYEAKESVQIALKKNLEKMSKGRYTVKISSSAIAGSGSQPAAAAMPTIPTNRTPTQKDMAKYMAAIQQYQQEMMGNVKRHKAVSANYFFEFRLASGQSGIDTGSAASTIGSLTGLDTSIGDISTKSTKMYLTATQRDPATGALIDKETFTSSSLRIKNFDSDYSWYDNPGTRKRLFKSAVKKCAKWINGRVK